MHGVALASHASWPRQISEVLHVPDQLSSLQDKLCLDWPRLIPVDNSL